MKYLLVESEFVEWAKAYNGPRFHAVLCDPPYGLEFMGKDWDRVSAREWGEAMMPLLYPGAIIFMFSGTRTWHKLATGMEEAGFEIWDTLMWLYGTGFPKAQDIGKLIDKSLGLERTEVIGTKPGHKDFAGRKNLSSVQSLHTFGGGGFSRPWMNDPDKVENYHLEKAPASELGASWSGHKTCALKPSWEPILCFRSPRQGKNYAELAMEYGSGALNVDGGRIPTSENLVAGGRLVTNSGDERTGKALGMFQAGTPNTFKQGEGGRYPANLILDEESAEMLDEQTGEVSKGTMGARHTGKHDNLCYGFKEFERGRGFGDKGGASRFFYCAKASRSEREQGLPKRDDGKPSNSHPTVKTIALIKWLATLLLPPDSVGSRRLLVPFAGVASEMVGALQAGWDEIVGVEQSGEYVRIGEARLRHWASKSPKKFLDRQPTKGLVSPHQITRRNGQMGKIEDLNARWNAVLKGLKRAKEKGMTGKMLEMLRDRVRDIHKQLGTHPRQMPDFKDPVFDELHAAASERLGEPEEQAPAATGAEQVIAVMVGASGELARSMEDFTTWCRQAAESLDEGTAFVSKIRSQLKALLVESGRVMRSAIKTEKIFRRHAPKKPRKVRKAKKRMTHARTRALKHKRARR